MPKLLFSAINSTVFDYANNYNTLFTVMNHAHFLAQTEGIALHVLSASPLTGPDAQAYISFINTQDAILPLELIIRLASETAQPQSDLITLISFPLYYRDASITDPAHPFYEDQTNKMNNRPFYATAIIQHGCITKIHLESYFEYFEGGPYDARYYAQWPMATHQTISLLGMTLEIGTFHVNGYGLASGPTQAKQILNHYPEIQRIILNGPGCYGPDDIRILSQTKTFENCTIIAANPLGSDSGDKVGSGSLFAYVNGLQITRSPEADQYSFKPYMIHIIDTDQSKPIIDSEDSVLIHTPIMKASALWLRDYLLKTKQQGFVISLSDDINSVYTLLVAALSIDLAIEAYGDVEAYLHNSHFGHLTCKKNVLKCLKTSGEDEAIRLLKHNLLTCICMPFSAQASRVEIQKMQELVSVVGGAFQVAEVGHVITSNVMAIREALLVTDDKDTLDDILLNNPDVFRATLERARVTEASITGNMDNKICISNMSATTVACGQLHAGGAGQEGPISVTLSLFQTQILDHLKVFSAASNPMIRSVVQSIISSSGLAKKDADWVKQEVIIETLINQKKSPMDTYHYLLKEHVDIWHQDALQIMRDIDEACRIWSRSQPSRVALSISPYLGTSGKKLDRYRSVRQTRDGQYLNNGRVELKMLFLELSDPDLLCVANTDPQLRDYILHTEYAFLDKGYCLHLIEQYQQNNQMKVRMHRPMSVFNDSLSVPTSFNVHIGVASLHQTMFDYSRNINNIKDVLLVAEQSDIDIILFPELSLTGYFGDGDFDWINTREAGDTIYRHALDIAQFAKHSQMVISIGLPVFIEGYTRPFVGQALLYRGRILTMSLKMSQPDGAAEFEAMHFTAYDPKTMGITRELLISGQAEPILVGKPVVIAHDRYGNQISIIHEQCAEAWAGVNEDGTVNETMQTEQRYINKIAKKHPGLIVLNPSGSKNAPTFAKTMVRKQRLGHSALEQNPNIAGYVYANCVGDDNGMIGADGDHYIIGRNAQGALILHQGMRHTLSEYHFSSMVVSLPKTFAQTADLTIHHPNLIFNAGQRIGITNGTPAYFDIQMLDEKTREYTETTYATAAWILNSLRHHKKQCFVISLSGGADSSFAAVQIIAAVDLFIHEHVEKATCLGMNLASAKRFAITELFKVNLAHLKSKQSILEMMETDPDIAIQKIKDNILVCVYMPTDNSSEDTLLSAQTLIEGGPCYAVDPQGHFIKPLVKMDGQDAKGLGGRFFVAKLQQAMEAFLIAYVGKPDDFETDIHSQASINALQRQYDDWPDDFGEIDLSRPKELLEKIIILFSEKKLFDKEIFEQNNVREFPADLLHLVDRTPPTWWDKDHNLAKQNLQPRLRSICPWLLAACFDGLPLFTSNLSEAAAGYSTWAGDTSLGYENPLGDIFKSDVRRMLLMYEAGLLCGLPPLHSLFYVNHLEPSAELCPLDSSGVYTQTDETDLMPYDNLDSIIKVMIIGKHTPWQTYQLLKEAKNPKHEPLFKNIEECAKHIHKLCWLFQSSQFKRTGGGNTPFLGNNLDPHVSQATSLFSEFLTNGRVEMNLKYLEQEHGILFDNQLHIEALLDPQLRQIVATTLPISTIPAKIVDWRKI